MLDRKSKHGDNIALEGIYMMAILAGSRE